MQGVEATNRQDLQLALLLSLAIAASAAVAIANPIVGGCLIGTSVAGFCLYKKLSATIRVLLFALPFDFQVPLPDKRFLYVDLAFLVLFVPVAILLFTKKLRLHWIYLATVPYLVFAISTTMFRAVNSYWFWGSMVRLLVMVLIGIVVSESESIDDLTLVLSTTMVPICIYGLYQMIIGELGSLYAILNGNYTDVPWFGRAYSFFYHPNALGGFCSIVVLLSMVGALRTPMRARKGVFIVSSLFGMVALLSSGSRGAWLAFASGLFVFFWKTGVKLRRIVAVVVVFGLLAGIGLLFDSSPIQRGENIDDFTIETRTLIYGTALLVAYQNPVIGVGYGNFQEKLPSIVQWDYPIVHAHNIYLHVLAEGGLIGLFLYYVPLFFLLIFSLRHATRSTPALAAAVGLIAVAVHGLVDNLLYSNPQYLFLLAVLYGLAYKAYISVSTSPARPSAPTVSTL